MGLLTEAPDIKFFATLPDITFYHRAIEPIRSNQNVDSIKELGKIFLKHGENNHFGLVLVHRHFDLEENEILVEAMSGDESLSLAIPWVIREGNEALPREELHWDSYVIKEQKYIIPQTWSITSGGLLKSFEYLSSPEQLPNPPQEFASELYEALKKLGLETVFGIRRLGNLRNKFAHEISPKDRKANVTEFIDVNNGDGKRVFEDGKHVYPVMWAITDEGNVRQVADCSSSTTGPTDL